ncbi:MAG TPA: permease prefix domain 1-containing protein, partial [Terriglobales bacterium]|nr:permease prefix domain 1-containing protein [Terriglobales bacterium]
MRRLRSVLAGFLALFHKEKSEQELREELSSYLQSSAEEKVLAGMSAEEALRAARLEMGSAEVVKEEVRAAGWENAFESCGQDLRYALRT